jgi:hypothetical protein
MSESIVQPASEVVVTEPAEELQSQILKMDQGPLASPIIKKSSGALSTSKATGPRTESGKKRSRRKEIKFGIFSKATLLKGESRSELQNMLRGFRKSFVPEGAVEELLVEELVVNSWHQKRLWLAERAEILKSSKFLEDEWRLAQEDEGEEISRRTEPDRWGNHTESLVGLIWNIHNPNVLDACLDLLVELRQGTQATGFVEGRPDELLCKIYGDPKKPHLRLTLHENYSLWRKMANATEEERAREGYPAPEQCKETVLRRISHEIKRLEAYRGQLESIGRERMNLEVLRQSVPDSPGFKRLIRYSSSLKRDFDRTFGQLERIQRMRRGQPVPPRLDVNLNP